MQEFISRFSEIIGGPSNGRWMFFIGFVLAFLSALPDLIPTFNILIDALPIKEDLAARFKNAAQTIRGWRPVTRVVMGVLGAVLLVLGGMVVFYAPPVALADEISTDQDVPATFNVLVNDRDQEGGVIVLVNYNATTARGGKVVCQSDGACQYTPPPGFSGEDRFTYDITYGDNKRYNGVLVLLTVNRVESPTATWTVEPSLTPTPTERITDTPTPTITETLTPTWTLTPTLTSTPSDTPTPTLTPTVTDTPTITPIVPEPGSDEPQLVTLVRLNVRRGPGLDDVYGPPLTSLNYNQRARILGISPDAGWWNIECPLSVPQGSTCWVINNPEYLVIQNAQDVPVVQPPPTPTPAG